VKLTRTVEVAWHRLLWTALISLSAQLCSAQIQAYERTFPQHKAAVEKALKDLQGSLAGRLPTLAGFAATGERPLDRYQRGYYQSTVQVNSTASGGTVVRVSTQVTAWYNDSVPSRSGYQLLTSNGRIEADFLDQLSEQLTTTSPGPASSPVEVTPAEVAPSAPRMPAAPATAAATPAPDTSKPSISAPVPRFPENSGAYSSSLSQSLSAREAGPADAKKNVADADPDLQREISGLEEVLKNQAHPKNLVAVKSSGTPVVATPSLKAKTLFLANAHDEFEILDFNSDWVHVRISGLSRGWIWRDSLEMPDSVPDVATHSTQPPAPTAAQIFHVVREETAQFPGDWDPLRGKNVKIVSVQKTDEAEKSPSTDMKLEFVKAVFDKNYSELAQKPQDLEGIVVIFDSVDGGMIAASLPVLQQWKAGTLSDAALWHQCFFDPPETFDSAASSASQ
jgi:hypothetical protein